MPKKTLIIGASTNPSRYSNIAVRLFQKHNIEIIAIGLKPGSIDNITIETELNPLEDIHTVTMYVGPQNQSIYQDYILNLKPKRIIFNPGTENLEFEILAREKNIEVLHACTLVMLNTYQY